MSSASSWISLTSSSSMTKVSMSSNLTRSGLLISKLTHPAATNARSTSPFPIKPQILRPKTCSVTYQDPVYSQTTALSSTRTPTSLWLGSTCRLGWHLEILSTSSSSSRSETSWRRQSWRIARRLPLGVGTGWSHGGTGAPSELASSSSTPSRTSSPPWARTSSFPSPTPLSESHSTSSLRTSVFTVRRRVLVGLEGITPWHWVCRKDASMHRIRSRA